MVMAKASTPLFSKFYKLRFLLAVGIFFSLVYLSGLLIVLTHPDIELSGSSKQRLFKPDTWTGDGDYLGKGYNGIPVVNKVPSKDDQSKNAQDANSGQQPQSGHKQDVMKNKPAYQIPNNNYKSSGQSGGVNLMQLLNIQSKGPYPMCENLMRDDPVPYERDYTKMPIKISGYKDNSPKCSVPCVFTQQQSGTVIDVYYQKDVVMTMESSVYYPSTHPTEAHKSGHRISMTPRLDSDVPVQYFSWAEYDFMEKIKEEDLNYKLQLLKSFAQNPKNTSIILATAVISNCGANTFRLEAVNRLKQLGIPISTYGACFPGSPSLPHDSSSKLQALRRSPFSLAFENSFELDYTTEKYWQSLVAGSIPIVIGSPSILDFDPIDEKLYIGDEYNEILGGGLIRIPSIDHVEKVAQLIMYIAKNPDVYLQMISWKYKGPGKKFLGIVDMGIIHSECRLCIYEATRRTEEEFKQISDKNPQLCTQERQNFLRIQVRERGRFYYQDILIPAINVQDSSIYQIVTQRISQHFKQMEHSPNVYIGKEISKEDFQRSTTIWNGLRKDVFNSAYEFQIFKIYEVGMTVRESIYEKFIDNDEKMLNVLKKFRPRLEVIFI